MSQHYSDPARESETYALPDVETFHMSAEDFLHADDNTWMAEYMRSAADGAADDDEADEAQRAEATRLAGWYYWFCFPGCLPESDPSGPFATEQEAIDDCREQYSD